MPSSGNILRRNLKVRLEQYGLHPIVVAESGIGDSGAAFGPEPIRVRLSLAEAPLTLGETLVVDATPFDAQRWYRIIEDQQVNVWYTSTTAIG